MAIDFNTLLALAFGCWAGVVGYLGQGIRRDIQALGTDLREESRKLNQYIVQTETRLARIESRHEIVNK
jgi:hypothetical protein